MFYSRKSIFQTNGFNHNLGGLFKGSFWGGGEYPPPCLETWNLARKYTHEVSEKILFSTKTLLILLMLTFFAKNQRLLARIVPLLKAIVWDLC